MEDPGWLRLITIGLVLSALAVGYFLLTGRFSSTQTNKPSPTAQPIQKITQASPSPSAPGLSSSPRPAPATASSTTTKGGQPISALPATGFPAGLVVTFSISAIAAGYGLRKYPN